MIDLGKTRGNARVETRVELSGKTWLDEKLDERLDERLDDVRKASTGQVTGQVESWILGVLKALQRNPLKSSEIQAQTGIRHRETFQRSYLDRLLDEEWIMRTLPDKPKSPNQRYRLNDKGMAYLQSRNPTQP